MSDTIGKIRELAEKATPGKEFTAKLFDEAQAMVVVDQKRVIATFFGAEFVWNAHLFAALRNDAISLLDAAEGRVKELEKERDEATRMFQIAHKDVLDWENREAAVCPEDVSFEEIIEILRKEKYAAESALAAERERVIEECAKIAEFYEGIADGTGPSHIKLAIRALSTPKEVTGE